jgi:Cys-rich protein (TIGR01571 family)
LEAGSTYCYDVPQEDLEVDGSIVFENTLLGVTPVCEFNSAESDFAWFNVLKSFSYPVDYETGFGPFLCWVSIFSLAIYFITSSDSGSLIVDHLASNGFEKTHWIQRVFWAFTEGAVATALLVAGGSKALRALQAASILSGLPFTLFLIFMCLSIHRMCHLAEKNEKNGEQKSLRDEYYEQRRFKFPVFGGVFNVFEHIFSLGRVHPIRAEVHPFPSVKQISDFFVALVVPFVPLYRVYSSFYSKSENKMGNIMATTLYAASFIMWVVMFALMGGSSRGLRGFAWLMMFFNGCILSSLRANFRARYNIAGNLFADYTYATLFWPQVLNQMIEELAAGVEKEEVAL